MLTLSQSTRPQPRAQITPIQRACFDLQRIVDQINLTDFEGATYTRLLERAHKLVDKIFIMPPQSLADLILKIGAAGVMVDGERQLITLAEWKPRLSGFACDDAAPRLLAILRDDLRRMNGDQ